VSFWCRTAVTSEGAQHRVRVGVDSLGRISSVQAGTDPAPDDLVLDTVLPAPANTHSHCFHRALRGRTHGGGGTFWTWRDEMYALAGRLDPERYERLATAVFAEMLVSGWTAVGEFHYVHHQPDGTPYPGSAMERTVASAARSVGIRLTLLDTCYLRGGADRPLSPEQVPFSDGDADAYLRRWHALRDAIPDDVVLGAAVHSVRAVPEKSIAALVRGLPADIPLHVHVSEQVRENDECLQEYGCSPTELLARAGALTPNASVVHATHVSPRDISVLADTGATAVFCPTTEADLGDGIGPARALADAGVPLALGSDQNAVVDPFLEARGLEAGERLSAQQRGRFAPAELLTALTSDGRASLGLRPAALRVGDDADVVELRSGSLRTLGSRPEQILLSATASDVAAVLVGGRLVARDGLLVGAADGSTSDPALLLRDALAEVLP